MTEHDALTPASKLWHKMVVQFALLRLVSSLFELYLAFAFWQQRGYNTGSSAWLAEYGYTQERVAYVMLVFGSASLIYTFYTYVPRRNAVPQINSLILSLLLAIFFVLPMLLYFMAATYYFFTQTPETAWVIGGAFIYILIREIFPVRLYVLMIEWFDEVMLRQ